MNDPASARTIFLHIHVPKCGGTSFNEFLWRNFRRSFQMEYGRFNMLRPGADEVEWVLRRNRHIRAIAGHRFHTRLNYETSDHNVIAATFVRDPVEHFLSADAYMRRTHYPGIEPLSLSQVARSILAGEEHGLLRPWFVKGQLRHLDPQLDLDRLRRLVDSGHLYLFPVEGFADACLLLRHRFPEHFTATGFRVKNRSPRSAEADPKVVELLREHRSGDFELHALAQRLLDQQLGELAPDDLEASRRRQRRRCAFLASPAGEFAYILGRCRDLTRAYLERRRWIGSYRRSVYSNSEKHS